MQSGINRQVLLAARPVGFPREQDLELAQSSVPTPGEGQMLCRTIYLSLDPYMRGRMNAGPSYAAAVEVGDVMVGGTVSEVVESNLQDYAVGDFVLNYGGWQEYSLSRGTGVRKLDPETAPISTAVGVLGMPGMTAYVGLFEHGRPQSGETVVVSAASGAVGSVVGQLAKIKGCRVVGVAGTAEKCDYLTRELGFDAAVNHRSEDLAAELQQACPKGIDVYFENVGGRTFDAVLALLNDFARMPVCGRIANYNMTELPPGPDKVPTFVFAILIRRVTVRGFIVSDHMDRQPQFVRDVSGWIRSGEVRYKEDIVDGIENAVAAFQGLLEGKNFGKLLVRLSDDPTR